MKRFIIMVLLTIVCCSANTLKADNFKVEGKTYSSTSTRTTTEAKATGYDWKDSKGKSYPIMISANGSCFVIRTSSKTGKEYKSYLGEEISRDICKKLNVEYNKGKSTAK